MLRKIIYKLTIVISILVSVKCSYSQNKIWYKQLEAFSYYNEFCSDNSINIILYINNTSTDTVITYNNFFIYGVEQHFSKAIVKNTRFLMPNFIYLKSIKYDYSDDEIELKTNFTDSTKFVMFLPKSLVKIHVSVKLSDVLCNENEWNVNSCISYIPLKEFKDLVHESAYDESINLDKILLQANDVFLNLDYKNDFNSTNYKSKKYEFLKDGEFQQVFF